MLAALTIKTIPQKLQQTLQDLTVGLKCVAGKMLLEGRIYLFKKPIY